MAASVYIFFFLVPLSWTLEMFFLRWFKIIEDTEQPLINNLEISSSALVA